MNGGEACITCHNTVAAVRLEMLEKSEDSACSEIGEIKIDNAASMVPCKESQQKHERITIVSHCTWAYSSDHGQVIREKALERTSE
jgi:hypothetical protein